MIVPLSGKIEDPDLWWHITTGKLIVQSHTIPTHDPFSYTAAGKEWIPHEWLSEIVFYAVYHRFDLAGIVWLRSLLVFLFTWSLYALVKRRIGDPVISAVVAVILSLATWCFWTERPQLFSYVLLVTLLRLIDRWKQGGPLWPVIPMFALWINLHGMWIAGFGTLTVLLAEEFVRSFKAGRRRRTLHIVAVYAGAIAALFVNPIGSKLVVYPLQYLGATHHTRYIEEWQRLNLRDLATSTHLIALIVVLLLAVCGRFRGTLAEWLLAAGSAAASLYSIRHIPIFAILAAPVISEQIKAIRDRSAESEQEMREFAPLNWALLAALAALFVTHIPRKANQEDYIKKRSFPIKAADFLRSRPVIERGRLMNTYNWGGYLIFRLHPSYRVSIDGRADLYGARAMDAEDRLEKLKGNWRADLRSLNPDVILWPRKKPLTKKLRAMPEYRLLYEDKMSVIFARKIPGPLVPMVREVSSLTK